MAKPVESELSREIERARSRLGITKTAFAALVGLSVQGLAKVMREGALNGHTLARLAADGGIRITTDLVASLRRPDKSLKRSRRAA